MIMADANQPATDRVGIVLVNYNGQKFMPDCLESLAKIDYALAQVIVVDNASTDGSADWTQTHYPSVTLIRHTHNQGITGGNNAGIEWCKKNNCDYVLLLNNDTVVEPDFLNQLLLQMEPDCLLVPKIYFYDNKSLINNHVGGFDYWRGRHLDWFYEKTDSAQSRKIHFAQMASTCALLIPISTFGAIGIMDEAYFMYSDDTDFLTRAVRSGIRIKFVPDAVLYHRESSSSGGPNSPLSIYYTNRNRLYFMFKHQHNMLALAFFFIYFGVTRVLTALRYLMNGEAIQLVALKNAISDFQRHKMGYASPKRFQGSGADAI